jgi:hypothetical protein
MGALVEEVDIADCSEDIKIDSRFVYTELFLDGEFARCI